MQPVIDAFERGWREAETMNLLDDALSADLARAGHLDAHMQQRIATLASYAGGTGVAGILFTCSAFGAAIEAVARQSSMPVLKPNEAMFEEALRTGSTIGLLATFQPAIPSLEQEFTAMAEMQGKRTKLESVWVPDAMQALATGDADRHDRLIAEAASGLSHCDVILLAQFSMAKALAAVEKAVPTPILTSPDSAVAKLRVALA
jgi:aspartate/glutamate racemase